MGSMAWRLTQMVPSSRGLSAANRRAVPPSKILSIQCQLLCGPQHPAQSPDRTAHLWKTGQSSELVKYHLNQTNALGETVAWPEGVGLGLFLHSLVLTAGNLSGAMGWVFKTQHIASMPQKATSSHPQGHQGRVLSSTHASCGVCVPAKMLSHRPTFNK